MSGAQHAPGPWRIDAGQRLNIVGPDFPGMGIIATVNVHRFPAMGAASDADANARLIAAAPDMLAALRECADAYDALLTAYGKPFGWGRIVTDNARAALALADGRSDTPEMGGAAPGKAGVYP